VVWLWGDWCPPLYPIRSEAILTPKGCPNVSGSAENFITIADPYDLTGLEIRGDVESHDSVVWWGTFVVPLYCSRSVQAIVSVEDTVTKLHTVLSGIESSIQTTDAQGEQFIAGPCFGVQTEVGEAGELKGGLESHGSVV